MVEVGRTFITKFREHCQCENARVCRPSPTIMCLSAQPPANLHKWGMLCRPFWQRLSERRWSKHSFRARFLIPAQMGSRRGSGNRYIAGCRARDS